MRRKRWNMAYELIYTSAERGLRPGTRGFCTVAHTKGMAPHLIQLMEALSAYKNLYGIHEMPEDAEPVAWSHIISTLAGHGVSVLSRVGAASADHTGRSNKIAHHVLVNARERAVGGPAWVCMQDGFLVDSWDGHPHLIEQPKRIPQGDSVLEPATAWAAVTGDAGYAAFLPEAFKANHDGIVVLAFEPGTEMLRLIAESLALLSADLRWRVTYSTYFTSLPVGATCNWRCCIAKSEALREARRNPKALVLDLTGPLPPPPTGPLAELARNGRIVVPRAEEPGADAGGAGVSRGKRGFIVMGNRNINQLNLRPRRPE